MLHCGQTAETMSRSREISPAQPALAAGSGPLAPDWFTLLKQPVPHAGSPYWLR